MSVRDTAKGMHWIGHPGSLVPIADYGGMSVTDDHDPIVSTSMSGRRRIRVHRGRAPRTWTFAIPEAHADDLKHVRTLIAATLPPYTLVTSEAQTSNVLTPEQSTLAGLGLSLSGWWPIVDGPDGDGALVRSNPSAAFGAAGTVRPGPAPIPPRWTGRAVTASAHVATARAAGARVVLGWLNGSGVQIASSIGNLVTGMDGLRRSTATGVPPAGAVAAQVAIQYAEVIAQPQLTWTETPVEEWSLGNGADRVVPTASTRSTEWTDPATRERRRGDYELAFIEPSPEEDLT